MGGICGDLAMILQEILTVKGYRARTIQLIRQVGSSYDTHVVTEVYSPIQKKFVLLDPTFNLMFKSNNNYINANDLKDIVLYKKGKLNIVENIKNKVAKLTKDQVMEIVKQKIVDLNTNDEAQAAKIVEGSCRSIGIEVA